MIRRVLAEEEEEMMAMESPPPTLSSSSLLQVVADQPGEEDSRPQRNRGQEGAPFFSTTTTKTTRTKRQQHHHRPPHYTTLLLLVVMVQLIVVPLWSSSSSSFFLFLTPCTALKHNFQTKHDHRTLIGPIGFPFGFLDTGFYNLTVSDFDLEIAHHDEENDDDMDHHHHLQKKERELKKKTKDKKKISPVVISETELTESIQGVGFLLKKFENEAAFNQYMSVLTENKLCSFEAMLIDEQDNEDDDLFLDDDSNDDYEFGGGDGTIEDNEYDDTTVWQGNVAESGLFLSMLDTKLWKKVGGASIEYSFKKGEHGLYFLLFQICPKPENSGMLFHVKFELDFHFSNLDIFGNESYLSAGEMILPHLFFYFCVLYSICLFLWIDNLRKIKAGEPGHWPTPGSSQPVIYPIHYLMGALLLLKTLSIFFESIRYHYIRVSGQAVLWSAVYYTFSFMKGTFLFTVILLIGSGWSFVKPFLNNRERNMIMGILVLQVVNNIAIVVLTQEAEGEKSYDRWTAILHMVDILCCCAVLIPIVWQVNQLEKNIEQSNGDHNDREEDRNNDIVGNGDLHIPEDEFDEIPLASSHRGGPANDRLVSKLRLFRSFYLLVVTYIYVTRIVVYLFATMLDYRHIWLRHFVVEIVTLVFYCMVGMQFKPMGENPYLSVRRGEDDGYMKGGEQAEIELTS